MATPQLHRSATATAPRGQTIQDMATLAGGFIPGRRRHMRCSGHWSSAVCSADRTNGTAAGSATVTGNGTYPSSAVTVTQAGRYRWIASYSGDANNNGVSTTCDDAGETSAVNEPTPTLTTNATTTATAGQTTTHTATVTRT